jgi:hypothetical protein
MNEHERQQRNDEALARWNAGWSRHSPLYLVPVLRGLYDLSRLKWDGNPIRQCGEACRLAHNELAPLLGARPLK